MTKKIGKKATKSAKDTAHQDLWCAGDQPLTDIPAIKKGIAALLRRDKDLKNHYKNKGIRGWTIHVDGFKGLIHIILAQQISTAVASHLVKRLHNLCPRLTPATFLKLKDKDLRAIGMSQQKISYARNLAEKIIAKEFDPKRIPDMTDDEAFEYLIALKGIGRWSAEIYLMFCLGRGDIWPAGDLGVQKALQKIHGLDDRPKGDLARDLGDAWKPHRTAAALILWGA